MSVEPTTSRDLVTVYWRPGCPYCASLRRRLRKAGLATTEVNIWSDSDAAATVRSLAHGNETVPTVVVAGEGLVNPPARVVLDAVRAIAPGLITQRAPSAVDRGEGVLAVLQWVGLAVLIIVSIWLDVIGHVGASWAADGVMLVWFLGIRSLRRRLN